MMNQKGFSSPTILAVLLGAVVFATVAIVFYVRTQSSLTQQSRNVSEENARLLQPKYCDKGEVYENILQKYKICYPKGWYNQPLTESTDNVAFTIAPASTEQLINIAVTTDDKETALNRLASDVYVDTTDRNYLVDNTSAFQVTGTVRPAMKKAITVVTRGGKTYEIVLLTKADAAFEDYLKLYKEIVASFKFL